MSNSKLATEKYLAYSGNYTKGRSGKKIEAITIHHMAGVLTAKQCGAIFQRKGRNGSSHYGIGKNGEIALYVDEKNTAWTNSNWDSNCKSVTIETSNSKTGGDWLVSDKVLNSLIKLVADIAKRNNLGTLVKGKNLTWHSMFTATTCPGKYLMSKMDYIISEANKINKVTTTTDTKEKTPSVSFKKGNKIVLNGYLYKDSAGNGKGTKKTNYKGTITIVNSKGKKPYHIDSLGWVAAKDIKKQTTTTTNTKKGTLTVNFGTWNVRKGAGTNYAVVKVVKGGTKLNYYGTSNGWYKIDGGYISPKAVKVNK